MKVAYIPEEILDIILAYDGRIKHKRGEYVNIIHKNDERYNVVNPIISKKKQIMQKIQVSKLGYYFEFGFDICKSVGLCYDYGCNSDTLEICYYDMRNNGWEQIRTYI